MPLRRVTRLSSGAPEQRKAGKARAFFASLDYLQITALLLLLGTGLLFIYSTGEQVGTEAARAFFDKQLGRWLPAGAVLWFFFSCLDYRKISFKSGSVIFFLFTTAALLLVLKYGVKVYGARRWLLLGGFRFQPSEFSKLSLILMLAWLFSSRSFSGRTVKGILLGLAATGIPAALICKEPDLGGTLILFPIFASMLFVSGLKWHYLLIALAAGVILFSGFYVNETRGKPLLKEYQKKRIEVFMKPGSDISNSGHNVHQSRLAVGAGGLWGRGIGEGTQHELGFLPQTVSNNDFIFSVIAEETGFAGSLLLLFFYALLLGSIFRTALCAEPFGRLISVGVGTFLFCHIFINIGMCIGLAPVTGLPLPFVSYGGSFILMGMAALGMVQSVYRHTRQGNADNE